MPSPVDWDRFTDDVRLRVNLLDEIGETVELRGNARSATGKCPFHEDKSASLVVWAGLGKWKCYAASCGKHGDVFDWVGARDGVDFAEARRRLAKKFNVPSPSVVPPERRADLDDAAALLKAAADFYHKSLFEAVGKPQRDYLIGRGFTDETMRKWHVGAAGEGNEFLNHLVGTNGNVALARRLGLISDKFEKLRDFFRNRIVIPFMRGGEVTYLSSRAIDDETKPKYLHLPNSDLAYKTIYNAHTSASEFIIVEGALDVWACETLSPEGVSAVALCGLGHDDPGLARIGARAERIYLGLDADGSVKSKTLDLVAAAFPLEKVRVVRWASGDDAAAWMKAGATAVDFGDTLELAESFADVLVKRVEAAKDKAEALEKAVQIAVGYPLAAGNALAGGLKRAVRTVIQPKIIDQMMENYRKASNPPPINGNGHNPAEGENGGYYRIEDGEIVAGFGGKRAVITSGGAAWYSEFIRVDDGAERQNYLNIRVRLRGSEAIYEARIPARDSGDAGAVIRAVKDVAGVFLSVPNLRKNELPQAMDAVSREKIQQITEIARTGWIETEKGWAYVTPGGIVGELPGDYRVKLATDFNRFGVKDEGEEAFQKGVGGLLGGLFEALPIDIAMPLLAFAILPPAARFMPISQKFALHASGETGSHKTGAAKLMMSLYGNFAKSSPLTSFFTTINKIEFAGFSLPDVLGMVDEYKPILVKPSDFIEMVHRYSDGNERGRLTQGGAAMQTRKPPRWWMMTTGEDIPQGEASFMARTIVIRFPRQDYSAGLRKVERLAEFYPTITARWVMWLMANGDEFGFASRIELKMQGITAHVRARNERAPNVARIAQNFAVLWAAWEAFGEFLWESYWSKTGARTKAHVDEFLGKMEGVVMARALDQASHATDQKPVQQFLESIQEYIDEGSFVLLPRTNDEGVTALNVLAGWYDAGGVYLLPTVFDRVVERKFKSQQRVGFSRAELYRLLNEEGMLKSGRDTKTTVIKVGAPGLVKTRRVLHLKAGVVVPASGGESNQSGDEEVPF